MTLKHPHTGYNLKNRDIPSAGLPGENIKRYRLYAPITGPGTLYETPATLAKEVASFMSANATSVDAYLESLAAQMIEAGGGLRNKDKRIRRSGKYHS